MSGSSTRDNCSSRALSRPRARAVAQGQLGANVLATDEASHSSLVIVELGSQKPGPRLHTCTNSARHRMQQPELGSRGRGCRGGFWGKGGAR